MIDVTMHAAQIVSGNIIAAVSVSLPAKKIEASTIVATTVTA